jgi:hypothetical protein
MGGQIIEAAREFVCCERSGEFCRVDSSGKLLGCTQLTNEQTKRVGLNGRLGKIGPGLCLCGVDRELFNLGVELPKCDFKEQSKS